MSNLSGKGKKEKAQSAVKLFVKFIAPYWKKGLLPVFFLFLSTAITFVYPMFSKWAIDDVVVAKHYRGLPLLAGVFLILIALQQLFSYLNNTSFFKFQKDSILRIQVDLLKKVFHYPMEFFDKNHSGYMIGRIRGDVAGLSYIFSDALVMTVMDAVKFIAVFFILLSMNVKLTLISIVILPFLVLKVINSKSRIKEINEKILEENARLERELSDTFQGIEVLKSFSREAEGIERTEAGLSSYQQIEVRRNVVLAKYRSIVNFISRFGEVLLLYFGILEVIGGHLTIGGYFAFSGYLLLLYAPIRNLSTINIFLDYAQRSYKRLKDLLDIMPEDSGGIETGRIEKIEARNLHFSYNGGGGVIRDLGFTVVKGDKVLIEGGSGSGKSTLIKLLLGLYSPRRGEIEYNGIPLKEIHLGKLRERVGYISQNIFLFNKTIGENILLGNRHTGEAELSAILKQCNLEGRVQGFAEGIHQKVSEKGYNFSGGERQRIALARALVKNPDIIILDEGTSNLDPETEQEILEKIEEMFSDRIIIRVTHRPVIAPGWKRIPVRPPVRESFGRQRADEPAAGQFPHVTGVAET